MSQTSNREQRRRKFGVDCPDRIVWKNWEPGAEYIRKVVIKNVDGRAQTISYRLPERRSTFLTPFPEDITLSSGMAYELEIRFCPTELIEIHDLIEISVKGRGSFVVNFDCLCPFASLAVPKSHDFGFTAVDSTVTEQVTITNSGTIPLNFFWEVSQPFGVEPSNGVLGVEESMQVTLSFSPTEACVVVGQAVCKMADLNESVACMQLSGVGKHPFVRFAYASINLSDTVITKKGRGGPQPSLEPLNDTTAVLEFHEVLAGSVPVAEVTVENPSTVPATVMMQRHDDSLSCPFKVTPAQCVIPRGGRQKFKVAYKANNTGSLHRNVFDIYARAGNRVSLETRGCVICPCVKLSTSSLNFGDVNLDNLPSTKSLTRWVQLKNLSNAVARYHFMSTAPGASFVVTPCVGSIPPKDTTKVMIRFAPNLPMNYLRRLILLVQDGVDALYLDVFGSAYTSLSRPMPFGLPEVESFHLRMDRGLGHHTPDELEAIANAAAREMSPSSAEELGAHNVWRFVNESSYGPPRRRNGRMDFREVFPSTKSSSPFSMESKNITFGSGNPSQTYSVAVFNSSSSAAMASWCVPEGSPYAVVPDQQDVPPNASCIFQIILKSSNDDRQTSSQFHAQYIECYVNYKQMRTFRLATERSFTPPHCFTIQCRRERSSAPSAGSMLTTPSSLVRMDSTLSFPTSRLYDSTFQVLSIENTGGVVLLFEVKRVTLLKVSEKVCEDIGVMVTDEEGYTNCITAAEATKPKEESRALAEEATVFSVYPSSGVLHPQQRVLLLVNFFPTKLARYEAEAQFTFNNNPNDAISILMRGESCIPNIVMEEIPAPNRLTFRPTCVTGVSKRKLTLRNPTCLPIMYKLIPSPSLRRVLSFEPSSGLIEREQREVITAYFSPDMPTLYEGNLTVVLKDARDDIPASVKAREGDDVLDAIVPFADCTMEYLMVTPVVGEGMHGVVEVEPTAVDCGDIAGLKPQTVTMTVYNSSMCELSYEVRSIVRTAPAEWRHVSEPPRLRNHCGVLPARSNAVVLVTVQPSAGLSEYIFYVMVAGGGTDIRSIASPLSIEEAEQHPHCNLSIRGTRPSMQITDVRSLSQQRSHLWRQLSINQINEHLAAPVQPTDVSTLSFAFPQYMEGLVPVPMDLGVGHEGNPPMTASMMIENAGDCPATFHFWLPTESDVNHEHWFLEDEELRDIHNVLDRAIIEVSPRSGVVAVGSSVVVSVTYRFDSVGIHTLPVLLRVNEGRKVLLVLEGRTLPFNLCALSLHHPSLYELLPVALGDLEPPMQSMTLDNPLDREVAYAVEMTSLRSLAEQNFGFPILQCINPCGVLAPRSMAQIMWYFRPLEAKEYVMDVSIHTEDGESYALTLTGKGYHPKKVSAEEVRSYVDRGFLSLPVKPALRLHHTLPVTLSMDVVRLGAVPYFAVYRRHIRVKNHHPTHTFSFQWDGRHAYGNHAIRVRPSIGMLRPGESLNCRFSMYTGSTSQLIEWPVTCCIADETALDQELRAQQRTGLESSESSMQTGAATSVPEGGSNSYSAGAGASVAAADCIKSDGERDRTSFQRTTCTKMYQSKSKKRQPVTTIPLESLGVRALSAKVAAARRQHAEGNATTPSEEDIPQQSPAVWNALELLVQARVMPLEDFERFYGKDALQRTFNPVLNIHTDPMVPPAASTEKSSRGGSYGQASSISLDEASLARDVLDEMLRSIVAMPQVRAAFTDPLVREAVYYRDVVRGPSSRQEEPTKPNRSAIPAWMAAGKDPKSMKGFIANVVEEALDGLIFSVVDALAASSTVSCS